MCVCTQKQEIGAKSKADVFFLVVYYSKQSSWKRELKRLWRHKEECRRPDEEADRFYLLTRFPA